MEHFPKEKIEDEFVSTSNPQPSESAELRNAIGKGAMAAGVFATTLNALNPAPASAHEQLSSNLATPPKIIEEIAPAYAQPEQGPIDQIIKRAADSADAANMVASNSSLEDALEAIGAKQDGEFAEQLTTPAQREAFAIIQEVYRQGGHTHGISSLIIPGTPVEKLRTAAQRLIDQDKAMIEMAKTKTALPAPMMSGIVGSAEKRVDRLEKALQLLSK